MDRSQILERLRVAQITVGTSETDFFSSNVPENTMRYVVAIILNGDGSSTRTVTIYKKSENGSYSTLVDKWAIAPTDTKMLPPNQYDVENPLFVLEGGTNIAAKTDGGAPSATLIYWDDTV